MIQTIKKLLGIGPATDYRALKKAGAIVLDVRTKAEYNSGHIDNSINIPVGDLGNNLSKFKDKDQPIICCCASGMRSGQAKRLLQSNGYTAVYNGGSWRSLQNKL